MTQPQQPQQQFTRPGAVDLSGLQKQAGASGGGDGAYAVEATEQNLQELIEQSMNAPVLLAFESPSRSPESVQLADDLRTLADEFEGRFLFGRVDIDAEPKIAEALQIQSVPMVYLVAQGRPMPLIQQAAPIDDLRSALNQVLEQLATSGFTGRHQPRTTGAADTEAAEEQVDPRYVPAQEALERGDVDGAVAEYQKLVDANPTDGEAAAGLAMAKVLQRTHGVDLNQARQAAADSPGDVDAQTMVADLDLLGGHVEDAFNRLIEVVRRTAEDERDKARTHLIGLFAAVGNEDARVQRARRDLASALF
ncbi:MAG: co-chaperone YbbN [Marmoricola sp.]